MKFLQKCRNGGFTLAEMLIVMAVVVILAAAAAPAIGSQAENARESNDLAAIREGFIEAYTQAVLDYNDNGKIDKTSGKFTIDVPIAQTVTGWTSTSAPTIGGVAITSCTPIKPATGTTVKIDYEFAGDATASTAVAFEFKGCALNAG